MKPYDIRRKMEMTRRYAAASATRQEKDSAISRAHDYVMLGYTLMNAADILFRRTEDIMAVVDTSYRYDDRFRIRESLRNLRAVIGRLDETEGGVDAAMSDADPQSYDRMRANAYEVIRFVPTTGCVRTPTRSSGSSCSSTRGHAATRRPPRHWSGTSGAWRATGCSRTMR